MGELARTDACRFSIVLLTVLGCLALVTGSARAATFEVLACDTAPGGAYGSWASGASDKMATAQYCPSAGREAAGLWAGNAFNVGTIPPFAASQQKFEPPPDTSIVFLSARYMFRRFDSYWRTGIFANSTLLHGCEPGQGPAVCSFNSQSIDADSTWGWTPGQVQSVSVVTACGSGTGCRSDVAAPHGDRAGIRLYGASVRIHDDTAPWLWDTQHGSLTNGAWQRGTAPIWFAGSDNVGFRRTRLYVDGKQLRDDERDCDFTRRKPCNDVTHHFYDVNTTGLPDGTHEIRIEGVDAAANRGYLVRHINSDNSAPQKPLDMKLEGSDGWRQTNQFKLTWKNPPSASPIRIARYHLCNVATNACVQGSRAADGISSINDLSVPAPGHYTARVWLEDLAGNTTEANQSDAVHLRFDNVPPGEARPAKRNGWLNAEEAAAYDQEIRQSQGSPLPVSGVPGYSITTDGSEPDGSMDVLGNFHRLTSLAEGVTTVKARAISGSGVPSTAVGSADIRVDKSPPVARAVDPPDADRWLREPASVTFTGSDQPHLSGMAAADEQLPLEDGGYMAYRLDGGDLRTARGGTARVSFADDGNHNVTFSAVDVAGNRSPERAVSFKIDRTAPELVVFEAPDKGDPRRVVVAASDRTSGVAGAAVEMRRLQGDSGDRWIELPSTRDGDRFVATVDDESVERGVYQLRARVVDRAGNESTGDRRRDGSSATVDTASLRVGTKLTAGLVTTSTKKTKKVCSKKRPGKKRKCRNQTTKVPGGALVSTLGVPFNKRVAARGTLEADGGAPLGDAVVDVYARSAAAGSEFERIAAVRTDPKGAFNYVVPAGTSRTVSFRFDGTQRYRGADQDVSVKVASATTMVASRRSVRNGESVVFRGKLRSLPIPSAGKILDLQAFYRGRWRTFATPRAKAKGKWSYRYRFGATRGTVPYRFRAVIRPESAYPYDIGYSKTVRVVVRGR